MKKILKLGTRMRDVRWCPEICDYRWRETPWSALIQFIEQQLKSYPTIRYRLDGCLDKELILKGKKSEVHEIYSYIVDFCAENFRIENTQ